MEVGTEVVSELSELIAQGHEISPGTIGAVTSALDQKESPSTILGDVVWTHRSTRVAPKTVNQKRYVDSIRDNTITFGIGPAGTGKTYLAMAMATAALSRRDVNRIILTRPAVEAGERLGFLPGNLMEKVDPYLRPLFDALYDMLDAERVNSYLDKGVIEVAPLAFMRGRAQPLSTPVLTPTGFQTDREPARRGSGRGVGWASDAGARRLSAGPEGSLPGANAGRRFDALLRRASLARNDPRRPKARKAGARSSRRAR